MGFIRTGLVILAIVFSTKVISQVKSEDNVIGSNYTIQSKVLESEREFQVFLPDGYQKGEKHYPVLYVLDSQQWFLYTVNLLNIFAEYQYTPEFIVVGVKNKYPQRFSYFDSKADSFLEFMEKELIGYVDKQFRTTSERMIFGWQYGGGFAIHTLIHKPELFDGYFSASPFPLAGERTEQLKALMKTEKLFDKFLYVATNINEDSIEEGAEELAAMLKEEAPKRFSWKHQKLSQETLKAFGHRTTPLGTLYFGLRNYYFDFPALEFNGMEDYKKAGGYSYVKKYFENRSKRYGLPAEIGGETMFFLVRMAMDEDSLSDFEFFMQAFKKNNFLDGVNLGWASRYANFYLKHNKTDEALELYHYLKKRFADSARVLNGIGDVYLAKKDLENAEKYYLQAVELGEKNSDRRLAHYKKDLAGLKK